MFWKLTFFIFLLVLMVSKNDQEEDGVWLFFAIIHFVFCMGASNLLIDVLAAYGIKPI